MGFEPREKVCKTWPVTTTPASQSKIKAKI